MAKARERRKEESFNTSLTVTHCYKHQFFCSKIRLFRVQKWVFFNSILDTCYKWCQFPCLWTVEVSSSASWMAPWPAWRHFQDRDVVSSLTWLSWVINHDWVGFRRIFSSVAWIHPPVSVIQKKIDINASLLSHFSKSRIYVQKIEFQVLGVLSFRVFKFSCFQVFVLSSFGFSSFRVFKFSIFLVSGSQVFGFSSFGFSSFRVFKFSGF